ncbi:uncharacterized protein EMH_0095310 [Eimeria mitis]|uniref:Secreted protein n=1 Tax=Eimeria mitis TaxID=44415 RepID=U6KMS5_9EIME|nr:uncharacterized protein EMH_0095310 [Eimeria mitis]CDJ36753.1 hypothetical protein EMH_0095310 [Eimeria mitis]
MTLGVQTMPYLAFHARVTLLVMLLTISTQELVLCGVYATPEVEAERQKTVDFIVEKGWEALRRVYNTRNAYHTQEKGRRMLILLEQCRTPRPESNPSELAVEASICLYRISQCYEALGQLQPWVGRSLPIPEQVSKQAFNAFSYAQNAGKCRLKGDVAASSWVEEIQTQTGCMDLVEPSYRLGRLTYRLPFSEEMKKNKQRFGRAARGLRRSIELALSNEPLEQRMQVQRHDVELRQQQGRKPLRQQQHPFAGEVPETIAGPSSIIRPVGQPATPGTGVAIMTSRPSQPPPAPWEGTAPAGAASSLRAPLLQHVQPPHSEPQQRIPTAHPGHAGQPPHLSAPSWGKMQKETKDEQQASFEGWLASRPTTSWLCILVATRWSICHWAEHWAERFSIGSSATYANSERD